MRLSVRVKIGRQRKCAGTAGETCRCQETSVAPAKFPDDLQPRQHDESRSLRGVRCFISANTIIASFRRIVECNRCTIGLNYEPQLRSPVAPFPADRNSTQHPSARGKKPLENPTTFRDRSGSRTKYVLAAET